MRQLVMLLSFFTLFAILGCGHSAVRSVASTKGRIYSLRGLHPTLGAYNGELEVRSDGAHFLVTRIVTYEQFRFENQQVQEIWQGHGTLNGSDLTASFQLKRADIFNKVDGILRSAEEFQTPLAVTYAGNLKRGLTNITSVELAYNDQILDEARDADEEPLWKDKRQTIASKSKAHQFLAQESTNKNFARALKELQKDNFLQKYKDRAEFKTRTQYFIFDPTDFEFLRANPGTLRVANKTLDTISLVESSLRRDAYAPTLKEKVLRFDQDAEENYVSEQGLYAGAHFDFEGKHVGYLPHDDALLWTGIYAAAQAMRWHVTQDEKALVQFKKSIRGLMLALDVTGAGDEFARTVQPLKKGESPEAPWRQGVGDFKNYKYLEGADRPMLLGLLYGFAWAYQILPEQDPLLIEVSQRIPKLASLKLLKDDSLSFVGKGFLALATTSEKAHQDYLRSFDKRKVIPPNEGDWGAANLRAVSEIAKIIMAQNILKKYKNSPDDARVLMELRKNLMKTWSTYASARRGFVTIAAKTFATESAVELNQDDVWANDQQQAIWLLREVPMIQTPHSLHFDFSLRPDWSLSGWSQLPPRYWEKDTEISRFYQGAYDFPLFESKAIGTDNYWASAFGYRGGASTQNRLGRVDYLHVYWMSRLGGIVSPAD